MRSDETRSILAEEVPTSDLLRSNHSRSRAWKKKIAIATGSCAALAAAGGVCAVYSMARPEPLNETATSNLKAMVPDVGTFEQQAKLMLGKELTLVNDQELNMPPFSELDLNGDGIVTKEEYLDHLNVEKLAEMQKGEDLPEDVQAKILQQLDTNYVDRYVCLSRLFARTTKGSINEQIYPMFYALDYTFCQPEPSDLSSEPTMVPTQPAMPVLPVEPAEPVPQSGEFERVSTSTDMPTFVSDDTPMPVAPITGETTMPLVTESTNAADTGSNGAGSFGYPTPEPETLEPETPVPTEAPPPVFTGMPTESPEQEAATESPPQLNTDGMPLMPGQDPAPVIPFVVYNTTASDGSNITILYPLTSTDMVLPNFDPEALNLTPSELNDTLNQVQKALDESHYDPSNPLIVSQNGDNFNNSLSEQTVTEILGQNPNETVQWGQNPFDSTVNSTTTGSTGGISTSTSESTSSTSETTTATTNPPFIPPLLANDPQATPEIIWEPFVPPSDAYIPENATSAPSEMPFIPVTQPPRATLAPPREFLPGWKQVPGGLKQVSFDGIHVCGVNAAGNTYCSTNDQISAGVPAWAPLPGLVSFVKVYGDTLYGVDQLHSLYRASLAHGYDKAQWERVPVPTEVLQVSYDGKTLCMVSIHKQIYCAKSFPHNAAGQQLPDWSLIPGSLKNIEVMDGRIVGVNDNDDIFVGRPNEQDPRWVQLYGKLRQISFDGTYLCGTSSDNFAFCAYDGLAGPQPNWGLVDSKQQHIVSNGGIIYATTTKGKIQRKLF